MVHPNDGTTHEDLAYTAAYQMFLSAGEEPTEETINAIIQECVDLFNDGARACYKVA